MTQEHPIIPPLELVQQWCHEDGDEIKTSPRWYQIVAAKAARWGADQELEACINYFHEYDTSWGEDSDLIAGLRAFRRPKPPSLKQQALAALNVIEDKMLGPTTEEKLIRKALEQLDD